PCSTSPICLPGLENRYFRRGGRNIIPSNGNRLRELFVRLYRATASSIRAARSHRPGHSTADLSRLLQRRTIEWRRHVDGSSGRVSGIVQLAGSPVYDFVMRLPVLAWSTALALVSMADLGRYLRVVDPALPRGVYAVEIAMRLSVIAYLVI